jgi:peptidylprolyl isomerase
MKSFNKRYLWLSLAMFLLLASAACKKGDTVQVTETVEATISDSSLEIPAEDPITVEGAITTESGLQYHVIVATDGDTPIVGDIITMHFIGTLPDGTEFGNSYSQGNPIEVVWGHDQLLPGWEEGIGLMKTGERAQFVIPAELGFGDQGFGIIPANSPIQIEMELLSIERPPAPTIVNSTDLITTDSGLQYYDILLGNGDEAIYRSNVATHYKIWVKGEESDIFIASSYSAESVPFVLGRSDSIFPGWEEGVFGMRKGGKRLLIIPPNLAFGDESNSGIPANSTLMMEIELVSVDQPDTISEVDEDAYTLMDSGLKYYDLKNGQGEAVASGQSVVVDYTGWLEDGTQFDSSQEYGQSFTFVLGEGQVITGWDQGIVGMQVGGIRQLVIPPELGYGTAGGGNVIPPDATLIFRVELLKIQQ